MGAIMTNTPYDTFRKASGQEYLPGTLFRIALTAPVYIINGKGEKQHIDSPESMAMYGWNFENVLSITKTEADKYPTGSDVTVTSGAPDLTVPAGGGGTTSNTKKYLLIAGILVLAGFLYWKYKGKLKK
jgi:hypothetical protein